MTTVAEYCGLTKYSVGFTKNLVNPAQYVGIEIELESGLFNSNWYDDSEVKLSSLITVKDDGSLRKNGFELVTSRPVQGRDVIKALHDIKTIFKKCLIGRPTHSSRTSTHIHMNMTDATLEQVCNVYYNFYLFEELFYKLGSIKYDRKHSSYAKSIEKGQHYYNFLKYYHNRDFCSAFNKGVASNKKYMSLHWNRSFGTFEFRFFDSVTEMSRLLSWINILSQFIMTAKHINHSEIKGLDQKEYISLAKSIFGPMYGRVESLLKTTAVPIVEVVDDCFDHYMYGDYSAPAGRDFIEVLCRVYNIDINQGELAIISEKIQNYDYNSSNLAG